MEQFIEMQSMEKEPPTLELMLTRVEDGFIEEIKLILNNSGGHSSFDDAIVERFNSYLAVESKLVTKTLIIAMLAIYKLVKRVEAHSSLNAQFAILLAKLLDMKEEYCRYRKTFFIKRLFQGSPLLHAVDDVYYALSIGDNESYVLFKDLFQVFGSDYLGLQMQKAPLYIAPK